MTPEEIATIKRLIDKIDKAIGNQAEPDPAEKQDTENLPLLKGIKMEPFLPCPFCGAEPEMSTYLECGKMWYTVECVNGDECEHLPGICGHKTKPEAVMAWNKRAPKATPAGTVICRLCHGTGIISPYGCDRTCPDCEGRKVKTIERD
jgi:hypothetical protein